MKIVIDIDEELYKNSIVERYHAEMGIGKSLLYALLKAIRNGTPLNRCKDCKYFETDVIAKVGEIPLIVGHEMCSKWGDGCKTKEDGYCFLFEAEGGEE